MAAGENDRPAASSLLLDIREGRIEAHAPHLLSCELLNGLYRAVKGKAGQPPRITHEKVARVWGTFEELQVVLHGTAALGPRILDMARTYDRPSIYDATYLALAESLGFSLITADGRLVHAVSKQLDWMIPMERYLSHGHGAE